ncbi:MAG: DUF3574 domain-containing protein [Caulobacter sp.]|nr:DUF3574 domain-containing protein [Caulobacter sp.]
MRLAALTSLLMLSACVSIDTDVAGPGLCPAGLVERATAELYFGRNVGETVGVTEEAWTAFVDSEVTPRFPDGLTVIDAAGQWRGGDGKIVREPAKAVMIVLSGEDGETAKLDAIRAAYKARFRQESVMLVQREACVGF